jgi:hypothetical protein
MRFQRRKHPKATVLAGNQIRKQVAAQNELKPERGLRG